jgi:hypothetical protein
MATKNGQKTGGRTKGTPNKATANLKAMLDRVFTKAWADPRYEETLVDKILNFTISESLLRTLLAYYAGTPTKQVELNHQGKVSLAALIAGVDTDVDDDDEGDGDD